MTDDERKTLQQIELDLRFIGTSMNMSVSARDAVLRNVERIALLLRGEGR